MNKQTYTAELEKGTPYIVVELLEYVPNFILVKTILRKTTGNATASSLNAGEALMEKTISFDMFVHTIDGKAEVFNNQKTYKLQLGEAIIVPAHSSHSFQAGEQFKMISTIIKSGYDN